MDTNVTGCDEINFNLIETLQNTDWASCARKISAAPDEKILYSVFNSTMNCWLALSLLLRVDKADLKLSHGRKRKASKIPHELRWRYFTLSELESIFFLVLTDYFSANSDSKISQLQNFIDEVKSLGLKGDLRGIFTDLDFLFKNAGGESIQKKIYRSQVFLLESGFSHIRIDLVSSRIRLCPITKDFDKSAALYMSQQPQEDIVKPEIEMAWQDKFGKTRFFYEIALDERVNAFHEKTFRKSQHLNMTKRVNPEAPKFGIVMLPLLSELMIQEGFSFVLFNQDRTSNLAKKTKEEAHVW